MAQSRRRRRGQVTSEADANTDEGTQGAGDVVVDAATGRVSCELPIDGAQGWYVSAVFVRQGDQLVMAELKVFPGPSEAQPRRTRRKPGEWSGRPEALRALPEGGVTARLLRCIRLTDLHELVAAALPDDGDLNLQPLPFRNQGAWPGNTGRSDRYYAEWAFAYAKKLAEGSRSPIKDLAAEHGRSPGQVRDLIHDARVRGMLSKERQGRAAGSLTAKAIEVLRDGAR
jgi:hypothetical protein